MSEQRGFDVPKFNVETTRAIANASVSGWMQIAEHLMDHTSETLAHQIALGRAMAGSRSIGELLEVQAKMGKLSLETAAKCSETAARCGHEITETSQNMFREMTGHFTATVNVATAAAAENVRAAEGQFRAAADQTREAATAVAREVDSAVTRASNAQNSDRAAAETPRSEPPKPNGPSAQADQTRKQGAAR